MKELFIRYKKALEGLTVGGSEYYNNLERCAEDIRHRLNSQGELIKKLIKERKELIKLIGGEWLWKEN